MNKNFKKGFTLIELLVVIAIIGVLSSIVLGQLNEARTKAEDARRTSDLENIALALELYRDDTGQYPAVTGGVARSIDGNWSSELGVALDPYIQLPVDSDNDAAGSGPGIPPYSFTGTPLFYAYFVNADRDRYDLIANLETGNQASCPSSGHVTSVWSFAFPGSDSGGTDLCGAFFAGFGAPHLIAEP